MGGKRFLAVHCDYFSFSGRLHMTKAQAAFQKAMSDPATARSMLDRPVTTLAQLGITIPHTTDADAARRLAETAPAVHEALRAAASGTPSQGFAGGGTCWGCVFALEGAAATLLAAGTVVLAADAPIVATIAAILAEWGPAVAAEVVVDWINGALASANTARALAVAIATAAGLCP
jgi:hypothetical protein